MAKPDEINLIFQFVLDDCILFSMRNHLDLASDYFGFPCGTPVLAILSHFWVMIKALVRPNLQIWTGFYLLIISGVKF